MSEVLESIAADDPDLFATAIGRRAAQSRPRQTRSANAQPKPNGQQPPAGAETRHG